MRLLLASLVLTLACASPAAAQITYGVKAGVNFANVSFDGDDVPSSSRVGVLAGAFATVPLTGWLSVQPEAIYTVKGASIDIFDIESDYIVDYVEVPVLARVPVRSNVYVAAGPSIAFRIRARSRTSFDGSTEEVDIADDVESLDVGIVGAAGFQMGRWAFDGRYTHGLSDTDADTSDNVKIRNRVFSVSAGFRF
ncbi:MAG TPA: porin family protein [Vicinamibacterales bacterium]|jgi:hypothetical protein|nr:porin family protein [Vicinamibacterales bacterium]